MSNSIITLNALAENGWTFLHWQGDALGTNNPLTLAVNSPLRIAAIFGTSMQTSVIGAGRIELSPTNPVPFGTAVRTTALPDNGSYFVKWGSALSGTNNPEQFIVDSTNLMVRAVFGRLQPNELSLTVRILGSGSVEVTPRKQYYQPGETVTLLALPRGSINGFNGWSGDVVSATNPLMLTLNTNKVVTANFNFIEPGLEIVKQDAGILLKWPGVYSSCNLLASTTLSSIEWIAATNPRMFVGNKVVVALPATNSSMFYRLAPPD